MTSLGAAIEAARVQHALSQSALAVRLGVRQQTVSRWEKDESRPRGDLLARLSAVLNLPADGFGAVESSGSRGLSGVGPTDAAVRPQVGHLPFDRLSAEQFEQFTADYLVRRFPDAIIARLGGQGDDQRGYDITVDFPDGKRLGVQCKRVAQFGPKKVAAAIKAAELVVDSSVIALARPATSAAVFETQRHPGWQLWDQDVLSRDVRALPLESATHLVRTYFSGYLEPFLGVRQASPWVTAQEFFADTPFTLLSHRQPMAGREDVAASIRSWASSSQASAIGLLIGRGGLGKSKLLYEVSSRTESPAIEFRFLGPGQVATPESFETLPSHDNLVVVVDDAHSIDAIAGLAGQLWRHRAGAKILLASRPQGVAQLEAETWKLNLSARTIERWTLEDLTSTDALALTTTLLGRAVNDPAARQLAAISSDCPLVAVIAADLLKRHQLDADTFASSPTLRRDILRRFADVATAQGSGADATERRAVLTAVAAYQPVRQRDGDFTSAFTALTGISSWDVIVGRLTELEDNGLLMRRGDTLRVVPDLLGDVLLGKVAFDDRSGLTTGYVQRAQKAATGAPLQHLLINASRMQWQVLPTDAGEVELVGDLWSSLRTEMLAAGHEQQLELLKVVKRIAFYQPAATLALVRDMLAVESPEADSIDNETGPWRPTSWTDVRHAIPPVLRNVAYSLTHMRGSLDILWELAQHDNRPTNQYPDHPMRVLSELSDLRSGKPLKYIDTVIDAAAEWLKSGQTDGPSPFDVLEPILATEASDPMWIDRGLIFNAHGIKPETVRDLRARVVDLAFREARSTDVVLAVRGVRALLTSIREPAGAFNRTPTLDERDAWAAEFVPVIEDLGNLGAEADHDPAIRIVIREALGWHAAHSKTETKDAAASALAKLHGSVEDDLALCLHDGWGRIAMRSGLDYRAAEQQRVTTMARVGNVIMEGRTADEVLERLDHRLRVERTALDGTSAGRFLFELFAAHHLLAVRACELAIANERPDVSRFASDALAALANFGDLRAVDLAAEMLSGPLELQLSAASALAWSRGSRPLLPGEFELLVRISAGEDERVRQLTGRAVFLLGKVDKAKALELFSLVDLTSKGSASEALFAFVPQGSLEWLDTSQEQREHVVAQLVECPSIDDYQILSALDELSLVEPLAVTELLIARVVEQTKRRDANYEALPDHWDPPLRVHETSNYQECLLRVCDWLSNFERQSTNWYGSDAAKVFELIAGGWPAQVLSLVSSFGRTASTNALLTVARIMSRAPKDVFFDNAPLIIDVLREAASLGDDVVQAVRAALGSRDMQVFGFWGDEPPPHEVHVRDRATELAEALPRGTVEERFFRELAADASARISWLMEPDARRDGREW